MPRHRTLDITIELNRCADTGALGYCCVGDHNREYVIEIDNRIYKNDIEEFITTLCHEMVHVMQTAKGVMRELSRPRMRMMWKGIDHTDTPYSRQPWERQAFRMQKKLANEFIRNNID